MKYRIISLSISELIKLHDEVRLNLNPPYQRNDIWTSKAQTALITSIKDGMPIPAFFFHETQNENFDIADGQQRTRAILAYYNGEITDANEQKFSNEPPFLNYLIAVIIINKSVTQNEIREFYVKVNNTGLRVNNPELTKAKYFNSKILKFVDELTALPIVEELNIFSEKQQDRMIDREFIEELIALIRFQATDKKKGIEKLYTDGDIITEQELDDYRMKFTKVFKVLTAFHKIKPLNETRFSQKNDLYTLYNFILNNLSLKVESFKMLYRLLIQIEDDISPSNEDCEPLKEYAYHCVTQSNSKTAKENRLKILSEILSNEKKNPNKTQKQLIKYYNLNKNALIRVENFLTLSPKNIATKFFEEE